MSESRVPACSVENNEINDMLSLDTEKGVQ